MDRRLAVILLALFAVVAALAWPEWRKYRKDPARYRQLAGTGVDLDKAVVFPDTHTDFAYEQSPLLRYLAYEKQFVDFDDQAIVGLADRVAEEVGWMMLIRAQVNDVRDAERLMWQCGEEGTNGPTGPGSLPNEQARDVMRWIAEQLIQENPYDSPEALYSASFAKGRQGRGGHIDCDQISHIFLHVAWRLDLDVREVLSPLHIYTAYVGPSDVAGNEVIVEPTEFRGDPRPGARAGAAYEVGTGFFMLPDELEKYGHIRASSRLREAAGYFQYATDRDIEDGIVSEVMRGISRDGGLDTLDAPGPDERQARFALSDRVLGELEAHLEGTRKPNLVTNLYLGTWRAFRWSLAVGDLERANRHATRLRELREQYDALLIKGEPLGQVAAARLAQAEGKAAQGRRDLRALYQDWGGERATRRGFAQSDAHAEILRGLALAGEGQGARDRYLRFVGPVLEYEKQTHADDARLADVAGQCAREMKAVDPAVAQECARLAR